MTAFQVSRCDNNLQHDTIDYLPSKDRATKLDIAGFVISIISHLVDVGFDINVAYRYYAENLMNHFFITLVFILVPAVINTVFSIQMYCQNQENKNMKNLTKRLTKRRLCYLVVLIFQLAPVLRYFDALRYAWKSKKAEKEQDIEKQRKYYKLMIQEDSDVALLRVLECFLEAAPQQILQLTIIFSSKGTGMGTYTFIHQFLSIGSSFVSMAWSMASYHRLIRVALINKNNISWGGTIIQFMWHFLVTVSRIMCISVIASILPGYTIIVLTIHWFLMVIWLKITTDQSPFCGNNKVFEYFFYAVFGTVYIFTHISLSQGRTLLRYIFFYTILCLENIIAMVIWMLKADDQLRATLYYLPIVYLNFLTFFVGIVFMILYYKVWHPSTGYIHKNTVQR